MGRGTAPAGGLGEPGASSHLAARRPSRGRRAVSIRAVKVAAVIGVAGALLAASLSVPGAVAASNAPTGSTAAIAFYKRSATAMARYQELMLSGEGASYEVRVHAGPTPFAIGFTPSGLKKATDSVKLIQRRGVVVEEVDTLSAPGEPSLTIWNEGRQRLVEQLQRAGACAYAVTPTGTAAFATIEQPFVDPEGSKFALLMRIGGAYIVRSTYQDEGATAHETDIVHAKSGLWISSVVAYQGGPFNGAATAMDMFRYKRAAPLIAVPRVGKCR